MTTSEAVARWVDGWARGWRDHDTGPIAALYADQAVFVSEPFREPKRGGEGAAEYAAWAFADEDEVELWFAEPIVEGARAAVAYWANIRDAQGNTTTLAGVATLWFDDDGRVLQQRDYWNVAEGSALSPPDGWGPFAAHERRG
jgi:ketosteroid isomerase-like protein